MFCPKCRAEYIPGYTICADCNVPLVEQLPAEPEPQEEEDAASVDLGTEMVHIRDTFNDSDVALMKSILDAEGIPYFFQGEYAASAVYHILPIRLMVPSAFAQRARELLDELDLNVGQIDLTHAQSDEEGDIDGEDEMPPMESGPLESAADEARDPRRPLGLSMEAAIILFIIAAILVFYWLY